MGWGATLTDASFCAFSGRFADSHELSELGEPGSGGDAGGEGERGRERGGRAQECLPEGRPPQVAAPGFPLGHPVL